MIAFIIRYHDLSLSSLASTEASPIRQHPAISWAPSQLTGKQSAVRESANSPITHRKNTFLRSAQYKGNYARPM